MVAGGGRSGSEPLMSGSQPVLSPVTGRSNREAAHGVSPEPDAWPAKAARHGRERWPDKAGSPPESDRPPAQLNVPGSVETDGETGTPPDIGDIMPPSQQGSQTGPQGSQTGPHGAAIGGGQGSPRRPQGERNSIKEGRRQLPKLPKQLLHPGAEARAANASDRQMNRDMRRVSNEREVGWAGRAWRRSRRHGNPTSRFRTRRRTDGRPLWNGGFGCRSFGL